MAIPSHALLRVALDFATGDTEGTWSIVGGTGAYELLHGGGRITATQWARTSSTSTPAGWRSSSCAR